VVPGRDKNKNGDHTMLAASRQALPPVRLLCLAIAATGAAPLANAAFIEDSSASLTATNIYLNRDFRQFDGQNKREEWGQGFRLDLQSGFTEGTVGFGVDAMGLLGLKLVSRGRSVAVAGALSPQERSGFAGALGAALASARRGPDYGSP